jgi:Phage Tail Collar Domain
MLTRVKSFVATGLATAGRLYAGDLNAIQDAVAAQSDYAQRVDLLTLGVGESGLALTRYGAGEARLTGSMRLDAILRALGGLYAGQFTTAARNAISAGSRPYGLLIWNTDTNNLEKNIGTDATPNWQPVGGMRVEKNGAGLMSESILNLIEGAGITLTFTDNPGAGSIDVVIAAPPAAQAGVVPIGGCVPTGLIADTSSFLICDGRSLVRTTPYDQLFTAISTRFGFVDSTHFNIPDLRGRTPYGVNTKIPIAANEGLSSANARHASHFHVLNYDFDNPSQSQDTTVGGNHVAYGHNPSGSYISLVGSGDSSNQDSGGYLGMNWMIRYQ